MLTVPFPDQISVFKRFGHYHSAIDWTLKKPGYGSYRSLSCHRLSGPRSIQAAVAFRDGQSKNTFHEFDILNHLYARKYHTSMVLL